MQAIQLRRLGAGLLMLASGLSNAVCVDGQGTGGKVYVGAQAGDPLGSLRFLCAVQRANKTFTGTVTYPGGDALVTTQLAASAWSDNLGLHATVSSKPTFNPHSGEDPIGAFPGYALAQAGSSLVFTLIAPPGAQPGERSPVSFEVQGNGTLQGLPGFFAGSAAYELSFTSNGSRIAHTGFYRDSNGEFSSNYMYHRINGPLTAFEFGATFTGQYEPGRNGFNLRLDLIASGDAAADLSHTVSLAGLSVAPGFSLELPTGLYTQDAPGHYILTSLLPVPEPAMAAMWCAGLPALWLLRRRRKFLE